MTGNPLQDGRQATLDRHTILDTVRVALTARLTVLQSRRLPSQRREARIAELRAALDVLDAVEHRYANGGPLTP